MCCKILSIYFFFSFFLTFLVKSLPSDIAWSFLQYKDSLGVGWKKFYGGSSNSFYYYKDYDQDSKEWKKVLNIFNSYFYGKDFQVDGIRAIYNPTLLHSFINHWKLTESRFMNSRETFFKEDFSSSPQQQWILEQYQKLSKSCPWNEKLKVPIIPAIHGTDHSFAEKIGQTGFANLSALDDGFFGKGIHSYINKFIHWFIG